MAARRDGGRGAAPALAVLLALAGAGGCGGRAQPSESAPKGAVASVAERIAFHRQQVEEDPRLHPAWAQLAEAWLDRARESRAVEDLRRARECVSRSRELQPTYAAFVVEAAVANFAHRFEQALEWCERARAAAPGDDGPELGMQVEALIGLGQVERAQQLVDVDEATGGFHRRAARGRILAELGREREAVDAYRAAAAAAEQHGVPALAGWALIRAAAVPLDAGRFDEAAPLLDAAGVFDAASSDLRVHRAELLLGRGHARQALALLADSADPFVTVTACAAAMAAGDVAAGRRLAAAAEPVLRAAVEAGEVYSLGALARLCDALGDRPDEAAAFAVRHAEVVRDRAAAAQRDAIVARARR